MGGCGLKRFKRARRAGCRFDVDPNFASATDGEKREIAAVGEIEVNRRAVNSGKHRLPMRTTADRTGPMVELHVGRRRAQVQAEDNSGRDMSMFESRSQLLTAEPARFPRLVGAKKFDVRGITVVPARQVYSPDVDG